MDGLDVEVVLFNDSTHGGGEDRRLVRSVSSGSVVMSDGRGRFRRTLCNRSRARTSGLGSRRPGASSLALTGRLRSAGYYLSDDAADGYLVTRFCLLFERSGCRRRDRKRGFVGLQLE